MNHIIDFIKKKKIVHKTPKICTLTTIYNDNINEYTWEL